MFATGRSQMKNHAPSSANAFSLRHAQTKNSDRLTSATATGMSFTATALPLPFDSPGHRLQTVPSTGPVTYACETVGINAAGTGTGTLRRYTGYATGAVNWGTQPAPPVGGTNSLLADTISQCTMTYTAGVTQRSGLMSLSLTLTRASESVTLYHEVHVDNQP